MSASPWQQWLKEAQDWPYEDVRWEGLDTFTDALRTLRAQRQHEAERARQRQILAQALTAFTQQHGAQLAYLGLPPLPADGVVPVTAHTQQVLAGLERIRNCIQEVEHLRQQPVATFEQEEQRTRQIRELRQEACAGIDSIRRDLSAVVEPERPAASAPAEAQAIPSPTAADSSHSPTEAPLGDGSAPAASTSPAAPEPPVASTSPLAAPESPVAPAIPEATAPPVPAASAAAPEDPAPATAAATLFGSAEEPEPPVTAKPAASPSPVEAAATWVPDTRPPASRGVAQASTSEQATPPGGPVPPGLIQARDPDATYRGASQKSRPNPPLAPQLGAAAFTPFGTDRPWLRRAEPPALIVSLRESVAQGLPPAVLGPLVVEQQRRWLRAGQNLRGYLAGRFFEARQLHTDPAPLPAWLCWLAVLLSDPAAGRLEFQARDHATDLRQLTEAPANAATQRFLVCWLVAALLGPEPLRAAQVAVYLRPRLWEAEWAHEELFYFFRRALVEPAQDGRTPRGNTPETLWRLRQDHIRKAEEILVLSNNYRNNQVKHFWLRLVGHDGPVDRLLDAARAGQLRAPLPDVDALANDVRGWNQIEADYRRNMTRRISTFLDTLKDIYALQHTEEQHSAANAHEVVLNREAVATVLEQAPALRERIAEEGCPSLAALDCVCARLQHAVEVVS